MAHDGEKRRDPRVPLVLQVDYRASPGALRDVTENLSAGGLFIRTDRELPVGARLPLELGFPGLLPPVEVEVEVVRRRLPASGDPGGVAVKVLPERVDDRRRLATLVESARAAAAAPAPRPYRVLVVEDNPHVIQMYEYALRKLGAAGGVKVEYAPHGHLALVRLEQPPPVDLVMTDLYMPVMDGFALVERLRGDPVLREIPILVISAGAADARTRALELGVDVYLQKPVQFADILATVRTLLRIPT